MLAGWQSRSDDDAIFVAEESKNNRAADLYA